MNLNPRSSILKSGGLTMTPSPLIRRFAAPLLAIAVVGLFTLVGTIERWGADSDGTSNEQRATSHFYPADTVRVAVDISGCTPMGMHLNSIIEVTIEVSSDLGWTAIGCTRFAHARAKPLPVSLVLTKAKGVNRE